MHLVYIKPQIVDRKYDQNQISAKIATFQPDFYHKMNILTSFNSWILVWLLVAQKINFKKLNPK
jgi:hypothetical protein